MLSSTACWARVTPTWCASAENRGALGRRVFWTLGAFSPPGLSPSQALGAAPQRPGRPTRPGVPRTRPDARVARGCGAWRHRGWRRGGQGRRDPCAVMASPVGQSAELRAPHTSAPHARAKRAPQGWRVPRGVRKSGSTANTAMRGRGGVLIRHHRWRGVWRTWGRPPSTAPPRTPPCIASGNLSCNPYTNTE